MALDDMYAAEWDDAIAMASARTPLERMYDVWMPGWDDVPGPRYRLWDNPGLPLECCICGQSDRWQPDNDECTVFVCEHYPIPGVPIRHLDSATLSNIGRMELVSSPMEEYYGT